MKKAAKFTPGPWLVSAERDGLWIDCVDQNYSVCHIFNEEEPTVEETANANLIAAAPDMYEALDHLVGAKDLKCLGGDYAEYSRLKVKGWELARMALKKARGES